MRKFEPKEQCRASISPGIAAFGSDYGGDHSTIAPLTRFCDRQGREAAPRTRATASRISADISCHRPPAKRSDDHVSTARKVHLGRRYDERHDGGDCVLQPGDRLGPAET